MSEELFKIALTVTGKEDQELFRHLKDMSPRRRGYMLIELAKKGLHMERKMNNLLDEFIDNKESQLESGKIQQPSNTPKQSKIDEEDDDPFTVDLRRHVG
jgi:uncharacterized protein with gpF-like domain